MNDPVFREIVSSWMASQAYRKLRAGPPSPFASADQALTPQLKTAKEGQPYER
jgi:hypothetical protein